MKFNNSSFGSITGSVLILSLMFFACGCQTLPKKVFVPTAENLKDRELQMRRFDTQNEGSIILASAGVLQDLGFSINRSETGLGVIVASKDKDATDAGQVALATASVVLAAMGGHSSNAFQTIDHVQKIKVSIVVRPGADNVQTLVRTTFQRVVWNKAGQVSKLETLTAPGLYNDFYEKLSKAVFLEAHAI